MDLLNVSWWQVNSLDYLGICFITDSMVGKHQVGVFNIRRMAKTWKNLLYIKDRSQMKQIWKLPDPNHGGNSLAVQWLGLGNFTARPGFLPAAPCDQKNPKLWNNRISITVCQDAYKYTLLLPAGDLQAQAWWDWRGPALGIVGRLCNLQHQCRKVPLHPALFTKCDSQLFASLGNPMLGR